MSSRYFVTPRFFIVNPEEKKTLSSMLPHLNSFIVLSTPFPICLGKRMNCYDRFQCRGRSISLTSPKEPGSSAA